MKPHIAAILAASLGAAGFGVLDFPTGSRGVGRSTGPGWSNAHAKRIARKARNVKRHRAASRGKA